MGRKPVYQEDLHVIAEDLSAAVWKPLFDLYKKGETYGVEPLLLQEMGAISHLIQQAHERLQKLKTFFPPEGM